MSFNNTVNFIGTYLDDRKQNILDNKRMRWSTSYTDSYTDLLDKFDRETENDTLSKLEAKSSEYSKLMLERSKIDFMAGCGRDIRTQFCCGKDRRQRGSIDSSRFEALRLRFIADIMINRLKQLAETT